MRTLLVASALLLTAPALAQTRITTMRESAFSPGTYRAYDNSGHVVAEARDSAFVPGTVNVYGPTGDPTGVQIRQNVFDPAQQDVIDQHDADPSE
jgi:hypothetical protein